MSETSNAARPLAPIPLEISMAIAQHLRGDLKSGMALTRTCTALRVTGEVVLYTRLEITGAWSFEPVPANRNFDLQTLQNRAAIVSSKLVEALHELDTHPERVEFVEEIRIEPSDGPGPDKSRAQSLVRLLRLVSHRIRRLEILPFPTHEYFAWSARAELSADSLFEMLDRENVVFPRLTHLQLGVQAGHASARPVIAGWMKGLIALESLVYSAASGDFRSPIRRVSLKLPTLRSLTFDNLYDLPDQNGLDVLGELMKAAPNINTLRLRGQWQPSGGHLAVRELGKLKYLTTIICLDEDYGKDDNEIGIHCQKFGQVEFPFEEMAVDLGGWSEQEELSCAILPIPESLTLQRLTIMTTPRPYPSEHAETLVRSEPLPTMSIHPWFLHRLNRTRWLDTILFLYHPNHVPSAYERNFEEPDLFVDPSRWTSEGYTGALVTHYVDHSTAYGVFWHIRTLSRAAETETGLEFVGARRVWRDQTNYNGRRVPRHILDRVYQEIGEEVDFIRGGRFWMMKESAWAILREWKEELEEGSDVDDIDYMAQGGADDDLMSDDDE